MRKHSIVKEEGKVHQGLELEGRLEERALVLRGVCPQGGDTEKRDHTAQI